MKGLKYINPCQISIYTHSCTIPSSLAIDKAWKKAVEIELGNCVANIIIEKKNQSCRPNVISLRTKHASLIIDMAWKREVSVVIGRFQERIYS